jgi:hypothetical protein
MKTILDVLFEKHNTWLKYVKSFGCDSEIAEDFVQEMYIKIYVYSQKKENDLMYNENEVNYFFVYVTLKNLYFDNLRLKKRIKIEPLSEDYLETTQMYSEDDFNLKNDALLRWVVNLQKEIESIKDYNQKKANLIYVKFIYDKIFIEKMSVTDLSKEAGISYWSLRNTILTIKKQIKNEIQNIGANECL